MKKIINIVIYIILFSSCKKEDLSGDYSVFVGTWKCENRYIHQTYLLEPVQGTDYEHTLHIYSNGTYRIELPNERDNKGRIRKITHTNGGSYNFDFVRNIFTSKRILGSNTYEIFYHSFNNVSYITIYTVGDADYLYTKIN